MNKLQYELLLKDVNEFNEYRQDNPHVKIDLKNVNFSCANLSYADLRNADLSYTNLSCVNLKNADLSFVNLYKANLYLSNLTNVDLSSVNLSNTNLSYADLTKADLYKANLKNATLKNTDFTNTNVENAIIPCMEFDPRGYILHIKYDKELRLITGCRNFTYTEAINHWSSNDYPDKMIGRLYVKNINKIMQDYNGQVLICEGKQNE